MNENKNIDNFQLIYGKKNKIIKKNSISISPNDVKIISEFEAVEKTIKILNKIEMTEINSHSFLSFFKYNDFSLWWFIRPSLFTPIKDIINFIDRFEKIIDDHNPKEIKLVGDFSKFQLIEQICKKKHVEFFYSKSQYFQHRLLESTKIKIQRKRFKQITKKKIDSRLKIFDSKKRRNNFHKSNVIFAIPTSYRRSVYDSQTGKSKKGEFIQGNLIKIINELGHSISCIDLDYTFRGEPEILKQRMNDPVHWLPLESIVKNKPTKQHQNFLKLFKNLRRKKEFKAIFQYFGINFWQELENIFETLTFSPHIPFYLQTIDSMFSYFKEQKPIGVFCPYETGPLTLAIILACEKNGIKTYGIQHSLWLRSHADYSTKIFRSKKNLLGMPIPTKMILFGEFTKQLLLEQGNYIKDRITILGNPAFFELDSMIYNMRKQDLKKKYSVPKNKKIILFATGKNQRYYNKQSGQNYDEQILENLLNNFARNNNLYFIIKPHPTEKNLEIYQELIKKNKGTNFSIVQGDLFGLLLLSDLSISVYSTSIIDSITLGIPSISVKFKKNDYYSLIENQGVVFTCMLDTLVVQINQLLSNPKLLEGFKSNRMNFVKYVYNIPNKNVKLETAKLIYSQHDLKK